MKAESNSLLYYQPKTTGQVVNFAKCHRLNFSNPPPIGIENHLQNSIISLQLSQMGQSQSDAVPNGTTPSSQESTQETPNQPANRV